MSTPNGAYSSHDSISDSCRLRPENHSPCRYRFHATQHQLIVEACAPFDKPALRETLEMLKKETEQTIDIYMPDEVLSQGFDAAAKAKAAGLVQAFRDYLAEHQTQIDALQILYSRPFKQRLTESMLKETAAVILAQSHPRPHRHQPEHRSRRF